MTADPVGASPDQLPLDFLHRLKVKILFTPRGVRFAYALNEL